MDVLLIGSDPILARLETIYEAWGLHGTNVPSGDPDLLMNVMVDKRPKVVVYGSSVDTDHPDAFVANSRDPAVVALYCQMLGSRMYLLSDSSVYSGKKAHEVGDIEFPVNVYGLSKMLGERATRSFNTTATIVRVGWLYGWEIDGCPPMIAVEQAEGKRKSALVYDDISGSPTFIGDAAVVLARRSLEPCNGLGTTVHLAPPEVSTWYEHLRYSYPKVESTTARNSMAYRDLRRNDGLFPSQGWTIPGGGLTRFQGDLAGEWRVGDNEVPTTSWHPGRLTHSE